MNDKPLNEYGGSPVQVWWISVGSSEPLHQNWKLQVEGYSHSNQKRNDFR